MTLLRVVIQESLRVFRENIKLFAKDRVMYAERLVTSGVRVIEEKLWLFDARNIDKV